MVQLPKITISFKVTRPKTYTPTLIRCSSDLAVIVRDLFDSKTFDWKEEMLLLCLNRRNEIMHYSKVSHGGLTGTVCDVRVVMLIALQTGATSIVLAHNHPSGNLKPSQSDLLITQQVKQAGLLFEIKLLDHIIFTFDSYYSMLDEGDL